MTKIVVIDAQVCGISGDMFLSALVDCGADKNKIIKKIKLIEKQFNGSIIKDLDFITSESNGIKATKLLVDLEEKITERKALETLRILTRCCEVAKITERGKKFVIESMKAIIRVECLIHNKTPKDLHLHESASIDTGIDLIGSAIALDDLDLFNDTVFYITKVAVGGGFTKFSHGLIPNPTNAVLQMLKDLKITIVGGPVNSEVTTPTGVAILFGLNAQKTLFYPSISVNQIGYGSGLKRFEGIPNLLRMCIGTASDEYDISKDTVSVLETNIDDTTGEILGNLIEKLSSSNLGVKDITITNGLTKKNRPVHILKVICSEQTEKKIVKTIFEETGTLGIRRTYNERYRLNRYNIILPVNIKNNNFVINAKISKDTLGNVISVKPEFESIKYIAKRLDYSHRKTLELVNNLIFQKRIYSE
ncbi:MAG: nickel pincer cofactor biosynthesis protein LarC [Thermoproteota archaeon]|nr:nickel pincer cofactor biosynthesis protein LarC [Thermoproteota archaeon]